MRCSNSIGASLNGCGLWGLRNLASPMRSERYCGFGVGPIRGGGSKPRSRPHSAPAGGRGEWTIYRVIQEALTNVFRHARATRVDIAVEPAAPRRTGTV